MTKPFLWERFTSDDELSAAFDRVGGTLAALRRAANSGPGEAPELWPCYTTLTANGAVTRKLRAEHACLTIYGIHQQGQDRPVHRRGTSVGEALRQLRNSDRFSAEAVDARVSRAAASGELAEMAYHLRGLVSLMRSCNPLPVFDYSALYRDFLDAQDEMKIGQVRRRWGSAYFFEPTTKKEKS